MSQLEISSHSHSAPVLVGEVLEGELLPDFDCPRCGESHPISGGLGLISMVSAGYISCCCGDEHQIEYCCVCGHYHDGGSCPEGPCGDYRCCIG